MWPCYLGAGYPTGGDGARQGQGAGGPLPRPLRPATHYQGIQLIIHGMLTIYSAVSYYNLVG